nr:SOS response-associated peptidase [uncultured Flavobacterium sp.]
MCYHTIQTKLVLQIEKRFKAKVTDKHQFAPHQQINGFDFPKTPIITNKNPDLIQHYNWGLIPDWANLEDKRPLNLNARIETLTEKPSFRDVVTQRCLIIANGFYEWQWLDSKGKNKMKYKIGIGNEDLFAFAGLYSHWTDTHTGEIKKTYTMVTTQANPLMAEIHNHKKRMPIILHPEDEHKWLELAPINQFALPYTVDLVAIKILPDTGVQQLSLF